LKKTNHKTKLINNIEINAQATHEPKYYIIPIVEIDKINTHNKILQESYLQLQMKLNAR